MSPSTEQIYNQPDTYDLEHAQPEADLAFFLNLAARWKPSRTLELACGSGRITVPLAERAAAWDGTVAGLDNHESMLEAGRQKGQRCANLSWQLGDMREYSSNGAFDLILCPCSSMSHILALDDHVRIWKRAFHNLRAGGRFVVAEQMATLPTLAESQHIPPRVVLEIDNDTVSDAGGACERLLRYRATRYFANEQRASIRFLYDKVRDESAVAERFISDYECHVFYPREIELLYRAAGFQIERVWGDYHGGAFKEHSRVMIVSGIRPEGPSM